MAKDIITGYNFSVYIEGIRMGFRKVTNIERVCETEPLAEGGVNDHVHSLFKQTTQEKVMTFERGVPAAGLLAAAQMLFTSKFKVGHKLSLDIIIIVKDRSGDIGKIYVVHNAVVKKWSCSELDAMNGELLVENFEVAYETLEAADLAALGLGMLGI